MHHTTIFNAFNDFILNDELVGFFYIFVFDDVFCFPRKHKLLLCLTTALPPG